VKFNALDLEDAYTVELEPIGDARGWFARAWCGREFAAHGLCDRIAQVNVSYNERKGTLRGMHYQVAPNEEAKVIRCIRGAIFDVIIDLRPKSRTFTRWTGVELDANGRTTLYVPPGFAHGFQTTSDQTEVLYLMSNFHAPDAARGVRFDDPAFAIRWPLPVTAISEKDRQWADFDVRSVQA
jgi:dTDP-4-dehydrorhamnose 3,5-epimerase